MIYWMLKTMNYININEAEYINDDMPIPQRLTKIGITNQQQLKKIIQIIYTDYLTNAYNRLYYNDIVNRKNIVKNKKTFFAILDIDYFKKVNDTYGHITGDIILKIFVEKLKKITELQVIRYGGEEFMLIYSNPSMLFEKIETARNEISKLTFIFNNQKFNINFSAGIGKTPQEADLQLYKAKNSGRAKTKISEEIEKEIFEKKINLEPYEYDLFDSELSISR